MAARATGSPLPSRVTDLIGAKVARERRAQRDLTPGVWYGVAMMGIVGWSIALPNVLASRLASGSTTATPQTGRGRSRCSSSAA